MQPSDNKTRPAVDRPNGLPRQRLPNSAAAVPIEQPLCSAVPAERSRRNSFDVIRMIAAFCVFISHELGMVGYTEPALGPLGITLSSTGLYIFFALSGYLIFKSLERDPRPHRFLAARALRILPASIFNTLFCVVLGATITTLPQSAYWTDLQTWRYLAHNLPVVTTPTQLFLPGTFADARWPVVNGSVWTIKYEILCYLVVFFAYWIVPTRLLSRRNVLAIGTAGLIAAYVHHIATQANPDGADFYGPYNAFNTLRFFMTFAAGAFCAAAEPLGNRGRFITLSVPALLILFGPSPEFGRAGIILLLVLFVVELGKTTILFSKSYEQIGDLSYGTFLYAYPLQNLITTRFFDGQNLAVVLGLATTSILACALLSWHLIERPCLRAHILVARAGADKKIFGSR